jgi:methylated-DNA-[protein]-cysteine S-methyltransferase
VTRFQRRVYQALREVPRGRVTTYALLARRVGCGSARAVGQALRRNPFAPAVPCHRVIASDLKIGGFQGERGGTAVAKKMQLLAAEGVKFRNGRLEDPGRLHPSFGIRP